MQPLYVKILRPDNISFTCRKDVVPHFNIPWHYHPELEITYVIHGSGTRFVGENIESFGDGDLVMVGQNIPHYWHNDPAYFNEDSELQTVAIVIHFLPDFLGSHFLEIPEANQIQAMIRKAAQGIKLLNDTKEMVAKKMQSIHELKGMERLLEFISMLQMIAQTNDYQLLSSPAESLNQEQTIESDRLNNVYQYILQNFKETITLEQVAYKANMSPTAFCRYFKSRTRKTFSRFLNEVRVGYACRMLISGDKNISEVCYESGYNHLSNFNIQFKNITKMSPAKYQKKHNTQNPLIAIVES